MSNHDAGDDDGDDDGNKDVNDGDKFASGSGSDGPIFDTIMPRSHGVGSGRQSLRCCSRGSLCIYTLEYI